MSMNTVAEVERLVHDNRRLKRELDDCKKEKTQLMNRLLERLDMDGPESEDGYDHEGFVGGCERMQCPGWVKEHELRVQNEGQIMEKLVDMQNNAKFWKDECVVKENISIALRNTIGKLQEESDKYYALAGEWEDKCVDEREKNVMLEHKATCLELEIGRYRDRVYELNMYIIGDAPDLFHDSFVPGSKVARQFQFRNGIEMALGLLEHGDGDPQIVIAKLKEILEGK